MPILGAERFSATEGELLKKDGKFTDEQIRILYDIGINYTKLKDFQEKIRRENPNIPIEQRNSILIEKIKVYLDEMFQRQMAANVNNFMDNYTPSSIGGRRKTRRNKRKTRRTKKRSKRNRMSRRR